MSYRSLDELSQALMAAFLTHHPTVTRDHTDRGAELLQFLIPNPQFPASGVSYEAEQDRGGDITIGDIPIHIGASKAAPVTSANADKQTISKDKATNSNAYTVQFD